MADVNHPIDSQINRVNQRMKLAQMELRIERRGEKLSIRGILPPRPHSEHDRPHQQRLSLNLPATPTGLKQAERQIKIITAELLQERFDWRNYLTRDSGERLDAATLSDQLLAYERYFLSQPHRLRNPASTQTTWDTAYLPYLRKLEATARNQPKLTLEQTIVATIQSTTPDSRGRQACCTALADLAVFLNLELTTDLKTLRGNYGNSRTKMRELPDDDLIVTTFQQLPNAQWQFVYGIMATYGLRNHEVFFCDYAALRDGDPEAPICVQTSTKTGYHEVWPFYPEWVEQFDLRQIRLPAVTTDLTQTTLRRVGQLVTNQFHRYGLPFSPYDLRHAWAVRTIHFGLPDTVAARMMGHSVAVHTRTYHQWLTRRDQQQAVQAALSRSRPPAPTLNSSNSISNADGV
jgi:integrase